MRLGLHQSARLEQRLIQSPQMIQAMQILQLPLLDLQERIEQELQENPFLEVVEERTDAGPEDRKEREDARKDDAAEDVGDMRDLIERMEGAYGDGSVRRVASGEDGDRKYEAMLNAPDSGLTLAEAVLDEVATLELTDRQEMVLEYVAWSLDPRGYLSETPATLAEELTRQLERERSSGLAVADEDDVAEAPPAAEVSEEEEEEEPDPYAPVSEDEVRDALERLREAVHPALGALDLREALLLQLPSAGLWSPFMRTLIERHLEDVQTNRLPQIARATKRDIEDVKAAVELLRGLDPVPAAGFGDESAERITPEVMVEEIEGDFRVRLDKERTPRLRLDPSYKSILEQGDKDEKAWVKKRLESASWFMDAILQRESTLERIANAIFRHQRPFLERGKEALRPLRMQEIADEVEVHISTVSRAVAGKYAQTPRGIFPLKFFFTGGTAKASGEVASQVTVQEKLKRIVENEDSKSPLSDDALAAALEEQEGIKIARRTVTKYRKALGIPSSTQRRQY